MITPKARSKARAGRGGASEKNSTVTVVISSGEPAEKIAVPNVVDRSEADAEKILRDAGLKVTKGEPQSSDTVAAGNVISSDPVAGTEVDEGTSVTIVISLGKEEVKGAGSQKPERLGCRVRACGCGPCGKREPGLQRYCRGGGMSFLRTRDQVPPLKRDPQSAMW